MADLSVVLCTFKRYDLALNCLQHLQRQTLNRQRMEVVVVDNTPAGLREDVDWQAHGADTSVVEEAAGLSRARNAGISASSAPLVSFIDDDAEAHSSWAANLIRTFAQRPEAMVVGGRVQAKYTHSKPAWMSARLEGYLSCIDWGEGTKSLERGQWIVGANMTFRRQVFESFGGFNASLGRIGHGTLLSNEETQLLGKLPSGSVFYTADATVDHLIPPERMVQAWFRKRVYWQAISDLLAGIGTSDEAAFHFEKFASSLPMVPAEDRSLRALHRPCPTAEDFERQLGMLYSFAMALGLGMPDQPTAGLFQ